MPQLFPEYSNHLVRALIVAVVLLTAGAAWGLLEFWYSPYITQVNVARDQPVPFSHNHHVSGIGIDCRYCHTSVDKSSFAGIPPTEICMGCHSQIWSKSKMLEPVRESYAKDEPLKWNRVHDVPDFVYFNHSIHIAKGVGCQSCHGNVGRMPLTWKAETMHMDWCLDCHRHPETRVRGKDDIYKFDPTPLTAEAAKQLLTDNKTSAHASQLTNCSVCHR